MSSRTSEADKRLLIAAPLRIEARALRRGARNARVVRTGMGPERSRRAVAGLRGHPAERVVVAGVVVHEHRRLGGHEAASEDVVEVESPAAAPERGSGLRAHPAQSASRQFVGDGAHAPPRGRVEVPADDDR